MPLPASPRAPRSPVVWIALAALLVLPAAAQQIQLRAFDGGGGIAYWSTQRIHGSMPGIGGNADAVATNRRLQGGYVPAFTATLPLPRNAADPAWLQADPAPVAARTHRLSAPETPPQSTHADPTRKDEPTP